MFRRSLLLTVLVVLAASETFACLSERREYGPFTVRQLSGRIVPPYEDALLSPIEVEFLVREKGSERSEPRKVTVQVDGTFALALPEGSYEFTITAEGFLFILAGDVIISDEADEDARIIIDPPWC